MLFASDVSLGHGTNDLTCKKHMKNDVIDYMLLFKFILNCMPEFSLGKWMLELVTSQVIDEIDEIKQSYI